MSVPKKRRSHSKVRTSKAHKRTLKGVPLLKCASCAKPKAPHQACPHCGQYKGRVVVDVEKRKQRAERRRKRGR